MGIISILMSLSMGISQVAACGDDPEDPNQWYYIGCRPSAGECQHSCPSNRAYKAELDSAKCGYDRDPWACYCPQSDYSEIFN